MATALTLMPVSPRKSLTDSESGDSEGRDDVHGGQQGEACDFGFKSGRRTSVGSGAVNYAVVAGDYLSENRKLARDWEPMAWVPVADCV